MTDLFPITDITREDVEATVRQALHDGLDAGIIADFVARIDWSGTNRSRPPIADMLGQLEAWASEYAEGEVGQDAYVDRLRSLIPEDKRARRRA